MAGHSQTVSAKYCGYEYATSSIHLVAIRGNLNEKGEVTISV
jgi:hypothetical protein